MKNIGIDVKTPETECHDKNCPFHGSLSVRGQIIEGKVASDKMDKTVVVKRESHSYDKKYERYKKESSKYSAHLPECIKVSIGDKVKIMECRPLSKTVSFVVIEKL
jgi:small subunit ribosomal protein S17